MISVSRPIIGKEEKEAVRRVLDSGYLVEGPKVQELESLVARACETKYAVAVNNGTSALHTALYAIGITKGDEIITTPFTFVATANAILMQGAHPVFVDIDPVSFNINPAHIEDRITKKTKAILAVDLYGQPADYTELKKIAKKYGLFLIEDAAQSIGAMYKNTYTGNLVDIATFSLYATKNIMCGEGGMVTTNNKLFSKRAVQFRNHGQPAGSRYVYNDLGYNYRMMDMQAAIALEQLKKLSWITKRRQEIARRYSSALSSIEGIVTPQTKSNRSHVFHQYTIRVTSDFKVSRDALKDLLLEKGIQSNVYYPIPLYRFAHLRSRKSDRFPACEKAVTEVLSLPVHPLLSDADVNYIISTILSI